MAKYGIFAAVILSILGYGWMLRSQNATLRAEAIVASVQLRGCVAQNKNIAEDGASDAEIDNLDDLSGAAAEWLRD